MLTVFNTCVNEHYFVIVYFRDAQLLSNDFFNGSISICKLKILK